MAGKARRAAARQGQLNRKRKKSQRGPSGIPSAAVADNEALDNEALNNEATVDGAIESATDSAIDAVAEPGNGVASVESVATQAPATATPTRPGTSSRGAPTVRNARTSAVPQGSGRIRGERPAAYDYVGAELRRISVLSVSVIAVLIVLGIVL
jgi:hypothetical protein